MQHTTHAALKPYQTRRIPKPTSRLGRPSRHKTRPAQFRKTRRLQKSNTKKKQSPPNQSSSVGMGLHRTRQADCTGCMCVVRDSTADCAAASAARQLLSRPLPPTWPPIASRPPTPSRLGGGSRRSRGGKSMHMHPSLTRTLLGGWWYSVLRRFRLGMGCCFFMGWFFFIICV